MRAIDLTGTRSGRWTVLARGENTKGGGTQWLCRCDCGTEKVVNGIVLRDKRSSSCGCAKREATILRSTKHGHATNGISPTYHTWAGMLARCNSPNHVSYARYGARGIRVAPRWSDFSNFLADMGEKPTGLSIDRINNDGDYCPSNCRWATLKEQSQNKRNTRLLTVEGKTQSLAEWAEEAGVSAKTIAGRLKDGIPLHLVLSKGRLPWGSRKG